MVTPAPATDLHITLTPAEAQLLMLRVVGLRAVAASNTQPDTYIPEPQRVYWQSLLDTCAILIAKLQTPPQLQP